MAKAQPTLDEVRMFAPKLMEMTDDVLFGASGNVRVCPHENAV